ncbi:CrcB protein [Rhodoblastus acidophilus]|uniref:fluoride efflux transporter CrcB n=1 Tax=Rhodoblastus acidophilus TaxID=1074 RepID=UPI0022241F0A|nr:fluoride efflux transporter CrcB [Rhodoblastus acidophilus]MCW2282693.1 CrcB protein [Rhodoblastus acidophilus]MCW2331554.1 CrcB protein [Rhodoblastus acidophilus]
MAYLIVFIGAGLGGCLRHFINLLAARTLGTGFPWGTFLINISGSLTMGLIAGFLTFRAGEAWTQHVRLFLLTGILGGYTTFSAFSLDAALLYERGELLGAFLYVGGSVALALVGVFSGLALVRALS